MIRCIELRLQDISRHSRTPRDPKTGRQFFCAAACLLSLTFAYPLNAQATGQQPGPLLSSLGAAQPATTVQELRPTQPAPKLIVIGFMGGRVRAGNLIHREALMARDLQQRYPDAIHAAVFANHDGDRALHAVLQMLDSGEKGVHPTPREKAAARIVIFGHSWGGSETVALARKLNQLGIPVLLTIQVDSVEKSSENDAVIPANVQEAVNFYQSEGLLHGRRSIIAMDPKQTTILGNFESTYRTSPVSCDGYPWFARTFMKTHIEIENDPVLWTRIEALIQAKVL